MKRRGMPTRSNRSSVAKARDKRAVRAASRGECSTLSWKSTFRSAVNAKGNLAGLRALDAFFGRFYITEGLIFSGISGDDQDEAIERHFAVMPASIAPGDAFTTVDQGDVALTTACSRTVGIVSTVLHTPRERHPFRLFDFKYANVTRAIMARLSSLAVFRVGLAAALGKTF